MFGVVGWMERTNEKYAIVQFISGHDSRCVARVELFLFSKLVGAAVKSQCSSGQFAVQATRFFNASFGSSKGIILTSFRKSDHRVRQCCCHIDIID